MSTIRKYFTQDFQSMEHRYRANFINSLGGFKSVILVGTRDAEGHTSNIQVSVEAGDLPAIIYILLHETTHVVDGSLALFDKPHYNGLQGFFARIESFQAGRKSLSNKRCRPFIPLT